MSRSAESASEGAKRELVTIRGIRNGLLFTLADDVAFADVLTELKEKLLGRPHELETQSALVIYVEPGARELTDDQKQWIRDLFAVNANWTLAGFHKPPQVELRNMPPYVFKGTLRSGMLIEHAGDVVVIGDVNPGAQIIAAGDVYVMGHLRGSAHAGAGGDIKAVVAAAIFEPLQVRIASVIRRSPDVRPLAAEMEFAYLDGDQMAVEKMDLLGQHRARQSWSRAVI